MRVFLAIIAVLAAIIGLVASDDRSDRLGQETAQEMSSWMRKYFGRPKTLCDAHLG